MNPLRFFLWQFAICLLWMLTFGSLAFVIVDGENLLTVLQGWGMEDPFQVDLGAT